MVRVVAAGLFLLSVAVPTWAAEAEPFNPHQPFEQALTSGLLRSLLNQALDKLDDHLEISGTLKPDDVNGRRHFRFKFYPEGKSKSDQYVAAEGWVHSSPETGQHDWHFTFKQPTDRLEKSLSPSAGAPL